MTAELPRDTHLDIPLDDEEPFAVRKPVYVDVVVKPDERRPIIPASLHGWANIKSTAGYWAGVTAYRVGVHAVRLPFLYLPLALFWSPIGVGRLLGRAARWWWHPEMSTLLHTAAFNGDVQHGPAIAAKLAEARKTRGMFLLTGVLLLSAAVAALVTLAPPWVVAVAGATAVPVLAHVGRPRTMPIVRPAVVSQRFRRINSDIVVQAYESAKLCNMEKPGQEMEFLSTMQRDRRQTGSWVKIGLGRGRTFKDVMDARAKVASGMDVTVQQVFLTRDIESERRHTLFVADRDPFAVPVGHTDLLDGKPRNIWQPVKLGRDERGELVTLSLLWQSLLIGAQPRRGKTFFVRLLLLYAALDPWVKILGADGKKSPDYDKFRLVAHRWVIGDAPNPRDNDPITHLLEMLDEILAHIARVNDVLSTLPVDRCPEGKLTEELARNPRYPDLRVWVVALEEFQVYFETEDQDVNKQIATKLQRIMAQGPSAGVILLSSSQKPSGVGAGAEMSRLFNRFRDNHQVRFALKCGNRDVSMAVLGGDAYGEGYDASALPVGDGQNGTKDYRGIGILYGASDVVPTVRTFLADHTDAEKILVEARRHRERLSLLSGLAAGGDVAREYRDVLRDVQGVFYAGEAWISWQSIASRLAGQLPEHYADVTKESISAQVRALGAEEKKGRDKSLDGQPSLWGVPLEQVAKAIERREIGGGGDGVERGT